VVEVKVILFLLSLLCLGIIGVYLKNSGSNFSVVGYNYSEEDSLFSQVKGFDQKLIEKSIDSEQELLDFTADKKESESKIDPVLSEKSININTADSKLLSLLPGIGEKTAEKIIDLRNSLGKFSDTRDLMKVKGIGEKKFEKLKKYIIVE